MSERGAGAPDAPEDQPVTPPPRTAGSMLRGLRESAGVDIALVASVLKVPLPKLQALEADRFDLLPDITFARGLASAVCRAFGVDPAPVLERMPAAAPGLGAPGPRAQPAFQRAGDQPAPLGTGSVTRLVLIVTAALLAIAFVLWLLPTPAVQPGEPPPDETVVPGPAPRATPPVAEPAPPPPAPLPVEPPANAASATASVSASASASAASTASLASADAASAPASAAASSLASSPAAAAVLGLTASGETWVSVRDAADKVLINRTLAAGDTLNVGGELPLAVTIGRKNAVAVTVRGKPFDHKSLGRSEVARFTVK